ncbi:MULTISPECIES: hypothetical protein [Clostridium]|uniref:hypothetical protein n=1 Tax=Clostridium TaxID=1485 RepID=UPI000825C4B3|nr:MULTISPECIES: hypothetical protein [Clostridium]PJI06599.1 hypothetical protein CUB90_01395 [Clostridium sp. CT7]
MNKLVINLIEVSQEVNENSKIIIEGLEDILFKSHDKYKVHGKNFIETITRDIKERNKVIEELKAVQQANNSQRLFQLICKLRVLDDRDCMSYRLFFSMYTNSLLIGKFIE